MSKIGEVREELDDLKYEYNEVFSETAQLVQAVRREHDDDHKDAFRWCTRPVCAIAAEMVDRYLT